MKWRKSGKRIAPSCWVRSHGVMNGRLAGSCSTEITKSRSDSIVGRRRRLEPEGGMEDTGASIASDCRPDGTPSPSRVTEHFQAAAADAAPPVRRRRPLGEAPKALRGASYIYLDLVAMQLHQVAAGLRLALAHQAAERIDAGRKAQVAEFD